MATTKETQQFQCTGDCLKCSRIQREYCGAQKGYDNQRILLDLQEKIGQLSEKVETLQVEGSVFNPNVEKEETGTTQEGDGVI